MKLLPILVALAAMPLLSAPAIGGVDLPDRVYVLVMSGHSFNGQDYPNTPLLQAVAGETAQFTVVVPPNAEAHTFHLHGHPWLVEGGRVIDTILLQPGESHTFTVTAGGDDEHPGDWMYHCHVDTHVQQGMWGVFRVHPPGTLLPPSSSMSVLPAPPAGGHVH